MSKRSLDKEFLDDLDNGILCGLVERIKRDSTLDLQFRGNYINVYYRGGAILKLEKKKDFYHASFDENYFEKDKKVIFKNEVITSEDMQSWIEQLPFIKQARDFHYDTKNTAERDFQQLIVRSNNYENTSNSSEFFITDMEYSGIGKIDLLGLEWSSSKRSSNSLQTKFAFIEVKFGNGAVKGTSGLKKHIEDIQEFVSEPRDKYIKLVEDTVEVFKQKRQLGLYKLGTNENEINLEHIEYTKPYFIVILADYKIKKDNLIVLLEELKIVESSKLDVRFATSSLMGYGLYSDNLLTVDELLELLSTK